MTNPFEQLSDQQLACLYVALDTFLRAENAHDWLHDDGQLPSHVVQPGRSAGRFPIPAGPDENILFRLGNAAHTESARRGLARIRVLLPPNFEFPFASWDDFCGILSETYEKRARQTARR